MGKRVIAQNGKIELIVEDGASDIDIGADGGLVGNVNIGQRVNVDNNGNLTVIDSSDTYSWTLEPQASWIELTASNPGASEYGFYFEVGGEVGQYDVAVAAPSQPPVVADGAFDARFNIWSQNNPLSYELANFGFNGSADLEIYNGIRGGNMLLYTFDDGGTFKTITFDPDAEAFRLEDGLSLFIQEQATANASVSTYGQVWVQTGAPNTLVFTDENGNDVTIGSAASTINATGSPLDNQIAVWTGPNTLEGDANFTWDGTRLVINATPGSLAATPTLAFGDGNTGFYEQADNELSISVNGARQWYYSGVSFRGNAGDSPQLENNTPSSTDPNIIPNRSDIDTGIGWTAADALSLVAGGVEGIRLTEASSSVIQTHEANVGLSANPNSAQGDSPIISTYNVYSTVTTAGDAATLPATFAEGTIIYVKNDGAESMDVFPASGDDAGAGLNTAVAVEPGQGKTFVATAADSTWTTLIDGGSTSSVSATGSPLDNQIAVFTNANTIEGDANFTWDGTHLVINATPAADPTTPTLAFGDGDTGFYESSDDILYVSVGGAGNFRFQAGTFIGSSSGAAYIQASAGAVGAPTYAINADTDTGMFSPTADAIALTAGGVEGIRFTEASSSVIQTHEANTGLTADVGSAQGNGVITSTYNVYSTVGTAGDAATLPATFPVGTTIYVKNDGANSMDVFPASGDDAGAGLNTAVAVEPGQGKTFIATVADSTWTTLIDGGSTSSVSATGSPLDNQIAVFTNGTTIEGDDDFTWDASTGTFTIGDVGGGNNTTFQHTANDLVTTITATDWTITGPTNDIDISARAVTISNISPEFWLKETDAATDAGNWRFEANAGVLKLDLVSDSEAAAQTTFEISRTGNAVGAFDFSNGTDVNMRFGGTLTIYDSDESDTVAISHNGTDVIIEASDAGIQLKPNSGEVGIDINDNGTVDLYNNGIKKAATNVNGFVIHRATNDSAGENHLKFAQADGTEWGEIGYQFTSAPHDESLDVTNLRNGGHVRLRANDTGGTERDLLVASADDSTDIWGGGVEAKRIYAGSVQTTGATTTELLAVPEPGTDGAFGFEIYVVGNEAATSDAVYERIFGAATNDAGTLTVIGSTIVDRTEEAGATTWTIAVSANNTNGTLDIDVTGEASHTIDWKCRVEIIEV